MSLFLVVAFVAIGQPTPNVLKNPWSTNLAGTPVIGVNNLSVTNQNDKIWMFYGTNAETVARLSDITNSGSGQFILKLSGTGTNLTLVPLDANGSSLTVLSNGGGTAFIVSSNSNVGIGSSNPAYKFQVVGAGSPLALFMKAAGEDVKMNGTNGWLEVTTGNSIVPAFFIRGTGAADLMNVYDSNTNVFRIIDGGNVGIGSMTNPAAKLTVAGNVTGLAFAVNTNQFVVTNGNVGIGMASPAYSIDTIGTIRLATNQYVLYGNSWGIKGDASPSLSFVLGTTKMILDPSGNVGIGTNNPQSLLHVANLTANSDPAIQIANDVQNWRARVYGSGYDQFQIYDVPNNKTPFSIAPNCADNTLVLTNGNVGIGVHPTSILHVRSDSTTIPQYVQIQNGSSFAASDDSVGFRLIGKNSGGTDVIGQITLESFFTGAANGGMMIRTTSSHPLLLGANNAEYVRLTSVGNVGIGTTTPTNKLDVAGEIRGSYGCATASTGVVTVATSTSTNLFTNWAYTKTYASIGMETNTSFVVTNAGDYRISFGCRLGGSNGNVLKYMLFTNSVHCPLTQLSFTPGAVVVDETGFKEVVVTLPANCRVDMRVANSAAANTTVDSACFNVKGAN